MNDRKKYQFFGAEVFFIKVIQSFVKIFDLKKLFMYIINMSRRNSHRKIPAFSQPGLIYNDLKITHLYEMYDLIRSQNGSPSSCSCVRNDLNSASGMLITEPLDINSESKIVISSGIGQTLYESFPAFFEIQILKNIFPPKWRVVVDGHLPLFP